MTRLGTEGATPGFKGTDAVPLLPRVPPYPLEIHHPAPMKAHAFPLEELTLAIRPVVFAKAHAPRGVQYPVPRDHARERPGELAQRRADGARGSRPAEHRRDLAVRHYLTAWDPANEPDDLVVKRPEGTLHPSFP